MDFSTNIQSFNTEFNLNAIRDYNKFLQGQASFELETDATDFAKALDKASRSFPLKDKNDIEGMGNFMDKIGSSFGSGLDSVNRLKIEADKMQEDIAMGGSTDIHAAMIAAQKAELSMQMAIQVRNRILSAYTEINSMAI
ncbi:flagellar hook-basal body complex protein FliE [bacterium]|nr:flagellar hook-basal body complex protein FliE [bacterium]